MHEVEGLRDEVLKLIEAGVDRDDLFNALESFRAEMRNAGDERSEDATADLMDLFVGWCRPEARL
jgi:hypothetical protein